MLLTGWPVEKQTPFPICLHFAVSCAMSCIMPGCCWPLPFLPACFFSLSCHVYIHILYFSALFFFYLAFSGLNCHACPTFSLQKNFPTFACLIQFTPPVALLQHFPLCSHSCFCTCLAAPAAMPHCSHMSHHPSPPHCSHFLTCYLTSPIHDYTHILTASHTLTLTSPSSHASPSL